MKVTCFSGESICKGEKVILGNRIKNGKQKYTSIKD